MAEDRDELPVHGEGVREGPVDGEAEHARHEVEQQGGQTKTVHPLVGDNIINLRNRY